VQAQLFDRYDDSYDDRKISKYAQRCNWSSSH